MGADGKEAKPGFSGWNRRILGGLQRGVRKHWFTLLLLGIVLAVIFRVISLLWPPDRVVEKKVIQVEVVSEQIPARQGQSIREGQWVQDGRTGDYLGKVVSVQAKPSKERTWEDGELIMSILPDHVDLVLIIEGPGEIREDDGVYLGRKPIRIGENRMLRTLYTVFAGRIDYLSVLKDEE
ncbi:MAG TPA: DUF4330 family protein [Firmicutes bacterium]|jgi:hypothetical protein|nr:DUF4330 family protein [Bacillota bacterium]